MFRIRRSSLHHRDKPSGVMPSLPGNSRPAPARSQHARWHATPRPELHSGSLEPLHAIVASLRGNVPASVHVITRGKRGAICLANASHFHARTILRSIVYNRSRFGCRPHESWPVVGVEFALQPIEIVLPFGYGVGVPLPAPDLSLSYSTVPGDRLSHLLQSKHRHGPGTEDLPSLGPGEAGDLVTKPVQLGLRLELGLRHTCGVSFPGFGGGPGEGL